MHDGWNEQLPDRTREDMKAWMQLALAMVGAGAVFGSLLGAVFGVAQGTLACWCCDGCD